MGSNIRRFGLENVVQFKNIWFGECGPISEGLVQRMGSNMRRFWFGERGPVPEDLVWRMCSNIRRFGLENVVHLHLFPYLLHPLNSISLTGRRLFCSIFFSRHFSPYSAFFIQKIYYSITLYFFITPEISCNQLKQ